MIRFTVIWIVKKLTVKLVISIIQFLRRTTDEHWVVGNWPSNSCPPKKLSVLNSLATWVVTLNVNNTFNLI